MRRRSLTPSAYLLMGATCFLVLGGLLMVYSASSVSDYVKLGDSAYHLKKQALYALLGILALVVVSRWDFSRKRGPLALLGPEALAWGLWGASVIGLLAVEIAGVGKWGATRSLQVGPVFVQPAEYAKLGCMLVLAVLVVAWRRGELTDGAFVGRIALSLGTVSLLIMSQPDMGTTMALLVSAAVLLWLGGVPTRWLALVAAAGVPVVAVLIKVAGYRMDRFMAFLDPWADPLGDGYQIIQSLYAFGSGGVFGVGLGLSRQKFFYLPAAHNDFIFAVIGEETGLLGSLLVVAAFVVFTYAGVRIALESRDAFGRVLAGGLTAMIVLQAVMNMAAVTGLIPITGIPLPLVSAGGSSLTLTLACVGLILAVSRYGGNARIRLVRPKKGSERATVVEWRRDRRTYLPGPDGGRAAHRRGA